MSKDNPPSAVSAEMLKAEDEACPGCGMTRKALYTDGAMGCARCYETFESEVRRALKEIHGEDRHIGKNSG